MIDRDLIEELIQKEVSEYQSLMIVLIVVLGINIIMEGFKFGFSVYLAKQDKQNKRDLLIEERRIKVLEKIFQDLDELTLLDKHEDMEMLSRIKEINTYISQHKLYVPKKFQKRANNILDYFKEVLTDYRKKDFKRENDLFEKFCDEFSK